MPTMDARIRTVIKILFNVVATRNMARNFSVEQFFSDTSQMASLDKALPALKQILSCVYIICDDTVKVHVYNIYTKAGVTNRSGFLSKVREMGE